MTGKEIPNAVAVVRRILRNGVLHIGHKRFLFVMGLLCGGGCLRCCRKLPDSNCRPRASIAPRAAALAFSHDEYPPRNLTYRRTALMHAIRAYLDAAGRRTPGSMSQDCAFMQVMNTLLVNLRGIGQSRPKSPRRIRKAVKTRAVVLARS